MTDFLSNLFVSDAFAQTSEQASSGGSLTSFVPLILIFLVFYFLLIRPQQKKAKEHQATLSALKKGNKVFTNSGIYGVVASIDDKENLVHL
jgi:preprotein translocase subunit YajC